MTETFLLGLYGAALSTGLLIWQITQHFLKSRPRTKLKATFARIADNMITRYESLASFKEPETPSNLTQVSLEIANIGGVPICLEEGGLPVTKRKHLVQREEGRLRIPPDPRMPRLPHDLARGQGYALFAGAAVILGKINDDNYRLTHMYFRDSTNKRYLGKLPRSFLKDLETLKRPASLIPG